MDGKTDAWIKGTKGRLIEKSIDGYIDISILINYNNKLEYAKDAI